LLGACSVGDSDTPAGVTAEQVAACDALQEAQAQEGAGLVVETQLLAPAAASQAYCTATVAMTDSQLRFNVWLPLGEWNRKLAFIGGGGFDGFLLDEDFELVFSPSILRDGYAIASTNGGYDRASSLNPLKYLRAEFAGDAQARADYLYQSEIRAWPHVRQLIEQFYGAGPAYSYFEGCSMGGHDALLLAQRHPEAFDGIVARAPAGNAVGLFMQFHRISAHLRSKDSALSAAQRQYLAEAVLAQCDALDGIADGIIARPDACDFQPQVLACVNSEHPDCLAPEQLELVHLITSPLDLGAGIVEHPGFYFGGENLASGWGEYIWPGRFLDSIQALFSDGFIRSFVTGNPDLDTAAWDPAQALEALGELATKFNAVNPDLVPLRDAGGKLILWQGTLDSSVSPRDSVNYYQAAVQSMGQQRADETLELYLAPGVGHCRGGPGPDQVDLMQAVSQWVEKGIPPSAQELLSTRKDEEGGITASRPLCKYPAYARYRGQGNPSLASSYRCTQD
tara:strand:- start:8904 stop:10430 length:1527 start_codon:yes stop_codon:yes gene_type:complete